MKKLALLFSIFIFLNIQIFAEISLISPIAGNWANKQMLVIENSSDGDFFYSIDGSDPETFGFAYDGPALIDVVGEVKLRISHIKADFTRETTEVIYNVNPDEAIISPYGDFIATFFDSGIINYSAGTIFSIPEDLYCSVGLPPEAYFPGTDLSLSPNCVLSRYIPITVMDAGKGEKWRFVLRTFPQSAGVFSRRDVPFVIEDWNTICFTDDDLIYKIDTGYWNLPKENAVLDRSVSHMISWQSIDYEQGNIVEFFILPPKPELRHREEADGSIIYYLDGDESYTISVFDEDNRDYNELYTEIGADVFYGDKYNGKLNLGVFASSVYQGQMYTDFNLNKRPPEMPSITSTATDFYSRKTVDVTVSGDFADSCDLYVSVSEPLVISDVSKTLNPDNPLFQTVKEGSYKKVTGNSYTVSLSSIGEGAAYYKIKAYSANESKESFVSEYSVIVDQYNYYFNETANPDYADGTAIHPFTDFTQCLKVLNENRNVCLYIKGQLVIPSGVNELLANTTLKTDDDSSIMFKAGSSLVVRNSSLDISNCRILNEQSNKYYNTVPLFKLENAVMTMQNCICATAFSKNANVFECLNSILNISESVVSAIGKNFASCISSVNSKINIKDSNFTATADTCVILSEHEGTLISKDNSFKIFAKNGRIAELFNVKAEMDSCQYKAELQKINVSVNPVYKNSQTELKEVNNVSTGF